MIQYFIAIAFIVVVIATILSTSSDRREGIREEFMSKHGRLYNSKVHDSAFFDGENEDYTEVMQRLKQYGGG